MSCVLPFDSTADAVEIIDGQRLTCATALRGVGAVGAELTGIPAFR
jgi:hypothetical protein